MAIPAVGIQVSVEPYAPREPATTCDPDPKPGVVAFRDFTLEHVGGRDVGISRGCDVGKASEHHEGRAWDWGLNAGDPEEAAKADEMIEWLLAPDEHGEPHANFRRAGMRYMIWNRRIWSTGPKEWRPYTGVNPHTDHVHFSWGWPGAMAQTSLYDWMGRGAPPPPSPLTPSPVSPFASALPFALGMAMGWWLAPRLR